MVVPQIIDEVLTPPPEVFFPGKALGQKIGKPKDLLLFVSNKIKGPKQDSQNRLRLPMPGGGETLRFDNNYNI